MTEAQVVSLTAALRALNPSPEYIVREVATDDWTVLVTAGQSYTAAEIQNLAAAHGTGVRTNRAEFF